MEAKGECCNIGYCKNCGQVFFKNRQDKSYCSERCRISSRNEKVKVARKHKDKKDKYLQSAKGYSCKCVICGQIFLNSNPRSKCCSFQCSLIYTAKIKTLKRKKAVYEQCCPVCGKNFINDTNRARIYCSNDCAIIAQRMAAKRFNDREHPLKRHKCANPECNHKTYDYYCSICRRLPISKRKSA